MKLDRTAAEIAALVGGVVEGPGERRLAALETLDRAGPADLAAVFRPAALARAAACKAGALLVSDGLPGGAAALAGRLVIRVTDAEDALDRLVAACAPKERGPAPGVHPSAIIEAGAELGPDVAVGPWVVVAAGARIGARSALWPGVYVGERAQVGADCRLHPHVVIGSRCRVGDRVILHAGVVIGADGFGFRQDKDGRHLKIPQVGIVDVGDDVEMGAHCTVDRARFDATRIGRGCKLDDQVHVGHNVRMGEHCAVAAQVALAGSVVLGDRVLIGGQTAVNSGVTLGAGTRVGGHTGVLHDTEPGAYIVGFPARPHRQWVREQRALRRLGARERNGADGADGTDGTDRPAEDAHGA